MTGFGKAVCDLDGQQVAIELSAVNHRYLDCHVRTPSAWASLEPGILTVIRKHVARGKFNVTVSRKRGFSNNRSVQFDADAAQQYIEASKGLAQMLGTYETLPLNVLTSLEGVLFVEEAEEDLEEVRAAVAKALEDALGHLCGMRETEGAALTADVLHRIELMRESLARVEAQLPSLNERYETRLRQRIEDLVADANVLEERIALEVAVMAEKADVTEEVVRLKTHLNHMVELLDVTEPVGRKLDFMTQEVQREVNTLGVKTRDGDVTKEILAMKSEVEKIREQVQNIE
jgi:uncharacterized protein (TIGR00255 family)